MSRITRFYLPLAVALALGGCGAVRSQATNLGSDVVGAIREKEPELFEIERQLADSMAAFVGSAVEDKVLSRASGVWDTMLLKVNEQSRVIVGQLAQGVERDLNRSVQVMLSENLDLADRRGGAVVDTVFARAVASIGPLMDTLRPELTLLVEEVTGVLSKRLKELDKQLKESETGKALVDVVWLIVGGLALTVIGGVLAWRLTEKRNRRAFQAALQATPPFQREAVQQVLRNQGFDRQADWLK
jgi:hypothetical protein